MTTEATAKPAAGDTQILELSPFQQRVCAIPEAYDMMLGGGRGGGKSFLLAILAIRHIAEHRGKCRILFLRQTYPGVQDFLLICRELFFMAFGGGAKYNAQEHIWRFKGGGYMELAQLESYADYGKFQGRSFSLVMVDEAGQYAEPGLLDKLRSNMRAPVGIPIRMVLAANPGDAGHAWLSSRFVFRAKPWVPFHEPKSGRHWVYCPSTFRDNNAIDQPSYRAQITAACPSDPELLRAWLNGDWAIARGAFFGSVLEEARNAVDPWHGLPWPGRQQWRLFLSYDHGSSAPAVCYVCAKSPGAQGPDGRWYPRGSIVLIDEVATHEPDNLAKGMGYTVPQIAEEIKEMARRWKIPASGVADDAIFSKGGHSAGSIADEFRRFRVYFSPARKADRKTGWERMRRYLQDAGKPDVPGLYIVRSNAYFWATVPFLPRDPRKPDDVDSRAADHAADAARYCLMGKSGEARQGAAPGLF